MKSHYTPLRCRSLLALLVPLLMSGVGVRAATNEPADHPAESLGWKSGPFVGDLRERAAIKVPPGFRFLPHQDTAKLLVMAGNRSSGRELGLIQHEEDKWWVVFEFDDVGYIKDDEKDKLDADKLLVAIKKGTEEGNKHRAEQGIAPMNIIGWHVKPNFNDQTKNLEWSILAESSGDRFVNYNVRLLGRKGVTEITLVDDLVSVDRSLVDFRKLIEDFTYKSGESYAEFKQGDQIAKYGLGALVVGGAAAVAYKVGLLGTLMLFFKKMWKLVIVGLVAIAAFFRRIIVGRSAPRELE